MSLQQTTWAEEIEATPEQIWQWIANPKRLPQWLARNGPFIHTVKAGGEMAENTTWQFTAADGREATFAITAFEPGQLLKMDLTTPTPPLTLEQHHTIGLDVIEHGTLVSWFVDWDLVKDANNITRAIISHGLGNDIEEMMAVSLLNLKQLIESEVKSEEEET